MQKQQLIPKTKFAVGQQVYVNTADGLIYTKIRQAAILIGEDYLKTQYRVEQNYETYEEHQIIVDKVAAKKRTDENLKQLGILFLENEKSY